MKKNVIVFGLISGAIVSIWMAVSVAICDASGNFNGNMWVGYASMLLAFSLVFAGVKNYRDKQSNGLISFGQAFKIGLYITLISSTMYVLTWLVAYYAFLPDFMDKYSAHAISQIQKSGATAAVIASKIQNVNTMKAMYNTPIGVVLLTYMEILPLGLIITIITALILKRKVSAAV
jgi:hypothetical protein